MRRMCIGATKAMLTDDRGVTFTAVRDGNLWILEGIAYDSPFKAFLNVERRIDDLHIIRNRVF